VEAEQIAIEPVSISCLAIIPPKRTLVLEALMLRTSFGLFVALLALAISTKSQTAPTIKGHVIGETVGQFFAKEPELQRELETCQEIAASQRVTENDVIHSKLARELKDSYRDWARQNKLYN